MNLRSSDSGLPSASGKERDCQLKRLKEMRVGFLGQEDPLQEGMQPTPVFLPGESHGQMSLKGYTVPAVANRRTQLNRLSTQAQ